MFAKVSSSCKRKFRTSGKGRREGKHKIRQNCEAWSPRVNSQDLASEKKGGTLSYTVTAAAAFTKPLSCVSGML